MKKELTLFGNMERFCSNFIIVRIFKTHNFGRCENHKIKKETVGKIQAKDESLTENSKQTESLRFEKKMFYK